MKFTKYLIGLVATMGFTAIAAEQIDVFTLVKDTPQVLLSSKSVVNKLTIVNGATNGVLYLYDSSSITEPGGTSVVVAAYPKYFSYSTNYESLTTNKETGYIYTNKFVGTYTTYTNTTAATNERPKISSFAILANTTRTITLNRLTSQGLVGLGSQAMSVEVSSTPE